ncbi:MAG: tetratricopeptide repeat protein, partial [Pseudomonadota bacterium]
ANRLTEGRNRHLAGEYAEVMVLANEGQVPSEAVQIFTIIRQDFPNDPQAIYYMALAAAQAGEQEKAIAELQSLRAASKPDAPWLRAVDGLLAELGAPPPAKDQRIKGPTAQAVAAAEHLSDSERATMINAMVEGLAARLQENPDNVEGWRRLGRAYNVLGKQEQAANAYREVLKRAPNDPLAIAFFEMIDQPTPPQSATK